MLVLAAKNLALAEQHGLNILTLCPGCAGSLKKTNKILKEDKALKEQINCHLKEVGLEFKGTIEVKHLLQLLKEDVGVEKFKASVTKPLTMLKVAEHNGMPHSKTQRIHRIRRPRRSANPENAD